MQPRSPEKVAYLIGCRLCQSLAYFYARENDHDANTAGVLTMDEARRLASNFAHRCNSRLISGDGGSLVGSHPNTLTTLKIKRHQTIRLICAKDKRLRGHAEQALPSPMPEPSSPLPTDIVPFIRKSRSTLE